MKKYFYLLFAGISVANLHAQDISDAMRYAQDNIQGTARFRAMGGAFGALGGDFSSLNVNPAGSAVFTASQFSATINSTNIKNKSEYFGSKSSEKENSFDLNQLGAVWVFTDQNQVSNWQKFTVGVNYENTNNFDNKTFAYGFNPNNSVSQYFLSHANQIASNNTFQNDQIFFGTQGNIIIPNSEANNPNRYVSNTPAGGNYYQENFVEASGYNGKLAFNLATQYKDRFYFGLNLNAHFTDFIKRSSFYEDYADTPGASGLQALRFNNELYTYGNGFSFQVGTIAKITNELRVGLAYESPTWYRLNDETYQNLSVSQDTGDVFVNPTDFNTIYSSYSLRTPGKYTGSLAYVFGKIGLISIDYSMKDYSNTKYSTNENRNALRNSNFSATNSDMNALLDATSEIRVGAEARAKQWSFRGGYRFEQSPYKNGNTVGDLHGISGGLGYNFGRTRLDAAYSYSQRDTQQTFFSQGLTDATAFKSVYNNISMTLLFEL